MIGARLKRVDAADERRARAMHYTVWTFAYMAMASHLGAHLVDVSGVAARSRHMVNFDETTLVLTSQSENVDRAVCDVEVLREMKQANKAVKT